MSTSIEPRSRRMLLSAGMGTVAAAVAAAFSRSTAVRAGTGAPVTAGDVSVAAGTTGVSTTIGNGLEGRSLDPDAVGVYGDAAGGGVGVAGRSNGGAAKAGVLGENTATGPGIRGIATSGDGLDATSTSGTAVRGASESGSGVYGTSSSQYGVHGFSATLAGVYGRSVSSFGVKAYSDSGAAVHAVTNTGFAVETFGRLGLYRVSGVATIESGETASTFRPGVDVSQGSFVLLTPRANLGRRALWFSTDPAANAITIRISAPRSAPTLVSWLLLG